MRATVWRALDEISTGQVKKIAVARAGTRRHVWALLGESPDGFPSSKVAGTDLGEVIVLDVDATIVIAHSEKEQASATFKKTFGYHPIGVWCDNTGGFLAAMLRTGKAGSNTAADHIEVLSAGASQQPDIGEGPDPGATSGQPVGDFHSSGSRTCGLQGARALAELERACRLGGEEIQKESRCGCRGLQGQCVPRPHQRRVTHGSAFQFALVHRPGHPIGGRHSHPEPEYG